MTQPDTIIPGGVQGYDRYAYVNNNPISHNDPTGHDGGSCNPATDPNHCAGSGGKKVDENRRFCQPGVGCWTDRVPDIGGTAQDPAVYISLGAASLASGVFVSGAAVIKILVARAISGCAGSPQCEQNTVQTAGEAGRSATQVIDQLVAESGTPTGDLVSKAVYPSGPGGLNGALDIFSKVIDSPIVRKYNEGVFVGKFPTGGDVVFRAVSSFPSTPVLQLNNVLGFPDILKIHFP